MDTEEGPQEIIARMSVLVAECENILFDEAPVMMHSIDENGILVKVNRRWQATLGYQPDEVLGRKSTEFLTEESRAQAISDTLPLFWEVGRAYSIGYGLVRKNGRVLDLLLDAETSYDLQGGRITLAALRIFDDLVQWRQAALTINALQGLVLVHKGLGRILTEDKVSATLEPDEQARDLEAAQMEGAPLLPWELVAVTQGIVSNLRALEDLEEQQVNEIQNLRQKLFLLADTIEATLSELTSTAG